MKRSSTAQKWENGGEVQCIVVERKCPKWRFGGLDPVLNSTTNELSDLRQVTYPLCTSFKWEVQAPCPQTTFLLGNLCTHMGTESVLSGVT